MKISKGEFFSIVIGIFLLSTSCQRKLEMTQITINLPNRAQQTMQFDYLGRATFTSQNSSLLTTNVVKAEAGLIDTKGVFNSKLPSLATGAAYPVNCYLVVVSGPESESDFTKNFCSKKTDPTQSLDLDNAVEKLYFGSYVGLIDAFNVGAGGSVAISLLPGQGRRFTLLGFNSANTCAEAFTAFQNKSNLSKAYVLASSASIDLLPGVPVSVDLNLPTEVNSSQSYSDCYIPNLEVQYPAYDGANISKPGFPYRTLRSFSTVQTTNFFCEALDIGLIGTDPLTGFKIPATVLEDEFFSIESSGSVIGTYDTAQKCAEDTSLTDDQATNYFKVAKNQVRAQRWFKRRNSGTSSVAFAVYTADSSPLGTKSFRQTFSPSEIFVDNIVPANLVQGVCYEGMVVLRDYKGYVITNPLSFDVVNTDTPTSFVASFYSSASDCEGNLNVNPNINFAAGQNSLSYYFKLGSGLTGFEFGVGVSGTTATNSSPDVTVKSVTTATPGEFASLAIQGRSGLPNNPSLTGGKLDCFPVVTSLVRSDLTDYIQDSTSSFTMMPLKVRIADSTGPNTSGYSIFSDDSCTVPIYPVGSTANATGTTIAPSGPSSSFYKMYIKPDNLNTYGARRIEFLYDDEGVGTYLFQLTDSAY